MIGENVQKTQCQTIPQNSTIVLFQLQKKAAPAWLPALRLMAYCPEGRFNVVRRRIRFAVAGIAVLVFALVCRSSSGPDLSGLPRWAQSIARWFGDEAPSYRGGGRWA